MKKKEFEDLCGECFLKMYIVGNSWRTFFIGIFLGRETAFEEMRKVYREFENKLIEKGLNLK